MPLGSGVGDDVDLPIRKSESSVHLLRPAVLRLGIRQIELRRTGLENHVAMRRIGNFAQALSGEHHRRILLAQRAKPLLDLRAKDAVGQHDPRFIEDNKRGSAVEALINSVEEISDDGHDDLRPHRHQRFELEGDEALFEQNITVGVNEAPERTRERIGA